MKNLRNFYLLLFAMLISSIAIGQVNESMRTMSLGSQPAYSIDLDGVDKKLAEKMLKEYIKDYGKLNRNKKAREHYAEQLRIPVFEDVELVNLYFKIEERAKMTTLHMWVDNGEAFVGEDEPDQAQGAKIFLRDYYHKTIRESIRKELEQEEKDLKNLEKDMKKLKDKNDDYHEDIEKAKEKIRKAEKDIEKNIRNQEDKQIEILEQRARVEKIVKRLNEVGKM